MEAHSTDTLLDQFQRYSAVTKQYGLGFEKRKDGGFQSDGTRAAVEDVVDAIAEAFQHVPGAGRAHVSAGVRARCYEGEIELLQQFQRKRVCGEAHGNAGLSAVHLRYNPTGSRDDKSERTGRKFTGKFFGEWWQDHAPVR